MTIDEIIIKATDSLAVSLKELNSKQVSVGDVKELVVQIGGALLNYIEALKEQGEEMSNSHIIKNYMASIIYSLYRNVGEGMKAGEQNEN